MEALQTELLGGEDEQTRSSDKIRADVRHFRKLLIWRGGPKVFGVSQQDKLDVLPLQHRSPNV